MGLRLKNIFFTLVATAVLCSVFEAPSGAAALIADLDRFPQRGEAYLPINADDPLVDSAEQTAYADEYLSSHFAPWRNDDLSYLDLSFDKIIAYHKSTADKRYYTEGGKLFPKESMSKIVKNGALSISERTLPGVCVIDADVRVLPTSTPLYSSADSARGARGLLKSDALQNSTIKPGEPVAIFARSKDNNWLFIATGTVVGWVKTEKIAIVDEEFMEKYLYASYSVFVRDNVKILDKRTKSEITVKMGTVIPSEGADILMPERGANGMASIALHRQAQGDVEPFPIAFTPRNAVRAMDQLLGEPYGWGGMYGFRDCSAMTRDYFSLFGIWLPRNSGDQASSGASIPLRNIPAGEKPRAIVQNGAPFVTLIHMPGHIMLYLGVYDGQPVVMHNVWGVRVNADGGKVGRAVIGKTVVSSLRAGAEISDRPKSSLYIDNVDSLAFPIGSITTITER
jgi:cell wall-associated NlpC family hydrolase